MSLVLFFVLLVIGFSLATVGSIVGIVESFRESAVWGLLYLFVPFASLVFTVKFWQQREWVRKGFFAALGGVVLMMFSGIAGAFLVPSTEFAPYEELSSESYGSESYGSEEDFVATTADGSTSATYRAHLRSQELAASRLSISLTKQKSI